MKKLFFLTAILANTGILDAQVDFTQLANTAMLNHPSPIDFSDPQQGGNATLVSGQQNIFATAVDDPWLHPYVQVFKGANGGWDICMTVDPAQNRPGAGEIDAHLGGREPVTPFSTGGFTDYETKGDLFLLGDYRNPYYAGKTNAGDPENDFVYLYRFDEQHAVIRLHGAPEDYATATAYNPETEQHGTAIFYIARGTNDFIGLIDGVSPAILPLNGPRFMYDTPRNSMPAMTNGVQISTKGANVFGRIAVDESGNIYQTFLTSGDPLPGSSGNGSFYLIKMDPNFNLIYAQKHGSIPDGVLHYGEYPYNIVVEDGIVFISGHTKGDFGGPAIVPTSDKLSVSFIAKFDAATGQLLQVKRLYGTDENSTAWNCITDQGGQYVYAAGGTTDNGQPGLYPHTNPFVKKLRRNDLGEIWSDTIISGSNAGVSNPNFRNISIECFAQPAYWSDPSGNDRLWVGGYSSNGDFLGGTRGATNAWIGQYNTNGAFLWGEAFYSPTGHQYPNAITLDAAGNGYIVGQTYSSENNAMGGAMPKGKGDGFIRKYNQNGQAIWTSLIGTPESDDLHDAIVVGNTLLATGSTQGDFDGANAGMVDGFLVAVDLVSGETVGRFQFGTPFIEYPRDIIFHDGHLIVSGITDGSLAGTYQGGMDVFTLKFDPEVLGINLSALYEPAPTTSFALFPNPAVDRLQVRHATASFLENYTFEVYDILGRRVLEQPGAQMMDVSMLPPNAYLLAIKQADRTIQMLRFVKM